MAQIRVNNLTFAYEGSFEPIFEGVSFSIDTNWKLGFIGRNGKGKTTFLRLLSGSPVYTYTGTIDGPGAFDYFPYPVLPEDANRGAAELIGQWKPEAEEWRVICELDLLGVDARVLYRPFSTLSFGERTKLMLAVLFSGENEFLLIDEPTNHLDQKGRESIKAYLAGKKGFILVSHDRDLLDACIDHVLVLNRQTIEVQSGNFSSWWENKRRKDQFAQSENAKHQKEIAKLKTASRQVKQWADKSESSKIGFDPVKDSEHGAKRAYIGAKTKKMQSRVKQMEKRIGQELKEKEGLLVDIESPAELKLMPLVHAKKMLVAVEHYGLKYAGMEKPLLEGLSFSVSQGERVCLNGSNGCGKSSLIQAILQRSKHENAVSEGREEWGEIRTSSGLVVSYVSQDTSFLCGTIREFCEKRGLAEPLFCALLRQLDLERGQFGKRIEEYSEGQKKKVLIAASLLTPAHLYIWDEPLNYIDVFSRMQIEKLILTYRPTMLVVEHDARFREEIATKVVEW